MRYAIIENGVVVNVVEAEPTFATPQAWVQTDVAGPGWTYADSVFSAPVVEPSIPPVPPSVSQAQLRIALHRRGQLTTVQAMIDATEDSEMLIRWSAPTLERHSPLLIAIASTLPLALSDADIDQLFREAAAL